MGRNNQARRKAKAKARYKARQNQGDAFFRERHSSDGRGSPSSGAQPSGAWPPDMQTPTLQEQARELTYAAVMAIGADEGIQERTQQALVRFAGTSAATGQLVGRTLSQLLQEALRSVWQAGWEPADLHRVAVRGMPGRRRPSALEPVVLADAMAGELARYAAGTVESRWEAQLAEIDAQTWWPRASNHLSARADSTAEGWQRLVPAALHLLDLIEHLPVLQVLGALPGKADAATRAAAERARQVDERILSKVRALLAKAESTNYEAEAETFTAGAQAMMARHSIDAAMLDAARDDADRSRDEPGAIRIGTDRPYESPKVLLLDEVARANRCRTVWSKELGFSTVLGYPPDLRAVETLFTSLLVQSAAAMQREGSRQTAWGQSRTRSFRQSFLMSYAVRIGERLVEVTREEEKRASRSGRSGANAAAGKSTGAEVVPVLAARSAAVDEATAAMFPALTHHRAARANDAEGWHRGRAAADEASLSGLEPLPMPS